MKNLKKFEEFDGKVTEGKLMKSKGVDSDVRKEQFREKVNNYIKGLNCTGKEVGNDLEVHCNDEHILQVMFREDYIGVKKEGNKFPNEFGYDEFGKIKKELSKIIKDCCK